MKRYTKWLSIIMVVSMILTTATACGKKDTVAETYKTMAQEYMDKLEHFIRVRVNGVQQINNHYALRARYDVIASNYKK